MGRIIYPDGTSSECHDVEGFIPYEYLLRNIYNRNFSDHYRAKCARLIFRIGVHGNLKHFLDNLYQMIGNRVENISLRTAASSLINMINEKNKPIELAGLDEKTLREMYDSIN